MSFDHKRVDRLERSHAKHVNFQATHIETTDDERTATRARLMADVDGVMVSRALANLCDEVRKIARGVKFLVDGNGRSQWRDGMQVISEVWAYYPGDEFASMRLGYADYSVRDGGINKYGVYSRNVKNEKFGEDREQYHMVMAESLPRAVANVKKVMCRYTVAETAAMFLSDFQSKLGSASWTASSEYNDAYNTVTKHGSFHNEMRSMIDRGYQFNDPAFGAAVKDMIEKLDVQMAKQYEQHHGYYVQVREYMGEQVFDVITVLDVKKATGRSVGSHKTFKAEELDTVDENLASRLAALSMLENGTFVEGLGRKVSPTSYWVLK